MTRDSEAVERHVRSLPAGQPLGREDALVAHFAAKWGDAHRARRAEAKAIADERVALSRTRGGNLIYGGTDAKLYEDVRTHLGSWLTRERFALVGDPIDCHSNKGARGAGDWICPDLLAHTRLRSRGGDSNRTDLHVFEVEHRGGFSIASVYQAFEHGRAANWTWVAFLVNDGDLPAWRALSHLRDLASTDDANMSEIGRRRILRAARERNVGLIAMSKQTQPSGWVTIHRPRRDACMNRAMDRRVLHASLQSKQSPPSLEISP